MRLHQIVLITAVISLSCRDEKIDPVYYGSLEGQVIDAKTNLALSNVSITTAPSTDALLTDTGGLFLIGDIPVGQLTILAKKEGYKSTSVNITIQKSIRSKVSIVMAELNDIGNLTLPHDPSPEDGAESMPLTFVVSWNRPVINELTDITYNVLLFEQGSLVRNEVAKGISDTTVNLEGLNFATTYFWQVNTVVNENDILPGDVWSFKTVDFPDNRFLYTSAEEGNYEVYSSDSSGALKIRLTDKFSRDWAPKWSPNRDIVAYTSDATSQPYIYTMNADGSEAKRISPLPVVGYHNNGTGFTWSPDGGQFIYSNYENLYRIDRNGTDQVLISKAPAGRHYRQCDWTGQGGKIVVETMGSLIYDNEFYLMDANGANRKRLLGNWPGIIASPSFSINGMNLLFTHDVAGFEALDGRQLDAHIFLMNLSDTTSLVDISINKADGTNDLQPRFSPDGSMVIFINVANDGSGYKEVWISDLLGNHRVKLFTNAEMPFWL